MSKALSNNVWFFIARYIRLYKKNFFYILCLISMIGLYPTIDSMLIKFIIDSVENLANKDMEEIKNSMLIWVVIYPFWWEFVNISWRLYDYLYLKTIPVVQTKVVEDLYNYIQYHSQKFFQENMAGNIANRISEASKSIEMVLYNAIESLFRRMVTIIGALIAMFLVHKIFAILLISWLSFFILVDVIFYYKITEYTKDFASSRATLLGRVVDSINNISSVRMFSRHKYERKFMSPYLEDTIKTSQKLKWFFLKLRYIQGFSCNILIAATIYYLVILRADGLITVGDFALILSLCTSVADDIWDLTQEIGDFFEDLGTCNQSLSLIIPYAINEHPQAIDIVVSNADIEFRNVTFNYTRNNNIFENVSLKIPGRQKVGLVGYSGSGKTTFVNLINRLFDVKSGEIFIDNQNIQQVTIKSLNENIAFIPQNPILFHRTVAENIKYGKLDATDDEIVQAAKLAHIHDTIMEMPFGYETICGEMGSNLSGGQRQRIAIARAILKNTKLLILDEATSALDSLNEQLIQESLNSLMRDKTVLVIAHRLSTLSKMDRIIVFDKGHIVEDGSHADLIKLNGLYTKLWQSQHNGFLPQ